MGKQWKPKDHYILLADNNLSSENVSHRESTLGIQM